MKISIIIVSWKVRDLLKKCLASIESAAAGLAVEIFVVDNASNDGAIEMVRSDFPTVRLIANRQNLGFAKANNLALRQASGDYVLLLNPDTELQPDTLEKSIDFFQSHPAAGALGAKMSYPDGRQQPSVRRLPTVWPIFLMLLKLPKLFPRLKSIANYLAADFDYSREQIVDQIMGAYIFMPRRILEQIGLLDDRFFIWFEEVDLCRRLRDAGYGVWFNPEVKIIHHGGKSFSQQALIANQRIFFSSALKYFLKYGFRP
ncbi:MAG: glycosyltransferase family 2 protein [Patescibacteria group bacterium]